MTRLMRRQSRIPFHLVAVSASVAALMLAGCGDSKKDKPASQTAAKVNKEEITIHQINYVLQQQRGVKPEQSDAATRQVLERLIDQELAVQKAEEMKLDRDPRVLQQLQAVRREIIARAYFEKTGESAAKPTADEVKKYFDSHPALFRERRIYNLQELAIEAKPDQLEQLRTKLAESKGIADFVEYLKSNNVRFAGNQAVRAAEQLPMNMLDSFAKLKDGQAMLLPSPSGAQVLFLAGSRSEPIDEVRARPAIEQFLMNDSKRKLVEADLKSMRSSAKIEYVGKFAQTAASGPSDAASTALPAPTPNGASGPGAADAAAITKGLSGLK